MQTPRPISATRNVTMKLTSATGVRADISMNVATMAKSAITSGTNARNEANTKARR